MIDISKFYIENQTFWSSKFWSFLAILWKIEMFGNQKIPNGISCFISCWKALDIYNTIRRKSPKKFRIELDLKIAFWIFVKNLVQFVLISVTIRPYDIGSNVEMSGFDEFGKTTRMTIWFVFFNYRLKNE
jgi:hypothetical protein